MFFLIKITNFNFLIIALLSPLFYYGGFFQRAGLLSITMSNLIISIVLIFTVIVNFSNIDIFSTLKSIKKPIITLFIYFLFIFFYHKSKLLDLIVYQFMIYIPIVSFTFTNLLLGMNKRCVDITIKFFILLLFIQVPVLLIQNFKLGFVPEDLNELSELDAMVGTFFINSDMTLSLFFNMFLIYILWFFNGKIITKYFFIFSIMFCMSLTNSKISILAFCTILILYTIDLILKNKYYYKFSYFFIILIVILIIGDSLNITEYHQILMHETKRIEHLAKNGDQIPRYGILTLMFIDKFQFFGNGMQDYYNYLSKIWKFNGGFSLWFMLYNDIGIFGVALSLWFLILNVYHAIRYKLSGIAIIFTIIYFSFVNVIFLDLGSMLIIVFFGYVIPKYYVYNKIRI